MSGLSILWYIYSIRIDALPNILFQYTSALKSDRVKFYFELLYNKISLIYTIHLCFLVSIELTPALRTASQTDGQETPSPNVLYESNVLDFICSYDSLLICMQLPWLYSRIRYDNSSEYLALTW